MPYFGILKKFGNLKKLFSYLKSAPSNMSDWKFHEKICLNLKPKMCNSDIFGA